MSLTSVSTVGVAPVIFLMAVDFRHRFLKVEGHLYFSFSFYEEIDESGMTRSQRPLRSLWRPEPGIREY